MTTKQIKNIKTINEKSVNELQMVLINAMEIAKKLSTCSKDEMSENVNCLISIRAALIGAINESQLLTPER